MSKRVFIAGHKGMVGSAIMRNLKRNSDIDIVVRDRLDLDLTCQKSVADFFSIEAIDEVYLAAAKVGGIHANNEYAGEFIYENLMIQTNVIHQAFKADVKRLLFLGSSCIYPKLADQPMSETALLTGALESTNEPYAIAKIAGIKLCESYNRQYGVDYRSIMPTNLYGPQDNFHPQNSHVLPALIMKFHEAKLTESDEVCIWGSGTPMREFLHVDDMASAAVFVMSFDKDNYEIHTEPMLSHINVGTGVDCTIKELAEKISTIVGYKGSLRFDVSKPDGAPRKLMDVSRLSKMGWKSKIGLKTGIDDTYEWFKANQSKLRG